VWFVIKAMCIFLLLTWVRWSFVRIRVDQILRVSWKLMLPATLLLLLATAAVIVWRTPGA
jgi:NADH-quinone oxidoreductase subunit H